MICCPVSELTESMITLSPLYDGTKTAILLFFRADAYFLLVPHNDANAKMKKYPTDNNINMKRVISVICKILFILNSVY